MQEFEKIYQEYYADIWHFLLCLTGYDTLTAEELTQETFYQAFLYFERFRGECQLRTWLFQVAKNVYRKYIRKESRQRQIIARQTDSSPPVSRKRKIKCVPDSKKSRRIIRREIRIHSRAEE